MNTFVTNTNLHAIATKDKNWKYPLDYDELHRFLSEVLHFGQFEVAERRSAWDYTSRNFNSFVSKTMKMDRFEAILRNLHWVNTASYTAAEKKSK